MTEPLDEGIILGPDGSLMGESAEDLRRGVDEGILYVCHAPDGTCPTGQHSGGPFLHYCDGYGPDDY